ncbi:PepSY domain-containing protein [Streptomyces bangladeshensis]|uniref:PepSY domain-containing protein n=1 Tax=Streptomyces bangladeshensis TaxID=295352 RepID=A0ABN3BFZ7_9ACTN
MVTQRSDTTPHRKSIRVPGLICAALAAGALLTGCGEEAGTGETQAAQVAAPPPTPRPTPSPTASLTEDQAERKALIPKAKVGYDKALSAAVAAVPRSKPVSIELKGPPDSPRWETEVATADGTAHTVRVDAVTGKAGQEQAKPNQDPDDKRELADRLEKATVTPQQAAQTATDKTKGTVSAVELDDSDGGTPKWSVDVVTTDDWNKTTYDIDASDRKILREHVDHD